MTPGDILGFCFPTGLAESLERHLAFWDWLMRGGADETIVRRYAALPDKAMAGEFDDWARSAHGRLALILILDQFPRSIFRGTAKAYAFDETALAMAEEGVGCGHLEALKQPWERTLFALPLVHAEGPTLRERAAQNVRLAAETLDMAPMELKPAYEFCLAQSRRHKSVIDQFGRHPHRNAVLGRVSSPDEETYLAEGTFPHQHPVQI